MTFLTGMQNKVGQIGKLKIKKRGRHNDREKGAESWKLVNGKKELVQEVGVIDELEKKSNRVIRFG